MARVRLHEEHDLPAPMATLFREIAGRRKGVPNLHKALAGSPGLFEPRLGYSNALRSQTRLDRHARELAIMVVATLTHAEYEFVHHWQPAIEAGVTAEQIEAIAQGSDAALFDTKDQAIIDLAREMTLNIRVSDSVWAAAAAVFDEQEMIELVLTIGWYNQTSRVLMALQIPLEEDYRSSNG